MNTYLAIFLIVILVMFLAKVLKSIGKAAVIDFNTFCSCKIFWSFITFNRKEYKV